MFKPRNVPAELRDHKQWLCWSYDHNKLTAAGKPAKIPYYASRRIEQPPRKRFGDNGTERDRASLVDFNTALAYYRKWKGKFAGIGFACLPDQPITFVDVDNCRAADGQWSPLVQRLLKSGTYCEVSPSGRGVRAVYTGKLTDGKANFNLLDGSRVELYHGTGYVTLTGEVLGENGPGPVLECPKRLASEFADCQRGPSGGITGGNGEAEGLGLLHPDTVPQLPGLSVRHALRVLRALPDHWGTGESGTWFKVAGALHLQFDGSEDGYSVLDAWSAERDGYEPESNRARWDAGFRHSGQPCTMKTLVGVALYEDGGLGEEKFTEEMLHTWGIGSRAEDDEPEVDGEAELDEELDGGKAAPVLVRTSLQDLLDLSLTRVVQLVPNWLTDRTVTLFAGDGGTGKSFLALRLAVLAAHSAGQMLETHSWAEQPIIPGPVLFFNTEDNLRVMHGRITALLGELGIDPESDEGDAFDECFHLFGVEGNTDPALLTKQSFTKFSKSGKTSTREEVVEETGVLRELREAIVARGARYVFIDNASNVFTKGASENDRSDVSWFMRVLGDMAEEYGCAIVLLAHTSKEGRYSGSTAWNNAARARWHLAVEEDNTGKRVAGGRKILSVMKANYTAADHGAAVEWDAETRTMRLGEVVEDTRGQNAKLTAYESETEDMAAMLRYIGDHVAPSQRELYEVCGGQRNAKKLVDTAIQNGWIERIGGRTDGGFVLTDLGEGRLG